MLSLSMVLVIVALVCAIAANYSPRPTQWHTASLVAICLALLLTGYRVP